MQLKRQQVITMNNLLRYTISVEFTRYQIEKKEEVNALATIPCTEISNEMVQGVGWLQVAKCTQGNIFNSIDEAPAGSRHDGIMSPFKRTVAALECLLLSYHGPTRYRGRRSRVSHHVTMPWDIIT
jgi:hypothetical protein